MTRPAYHLCARDYTLSLRSATRIMGIINCTPDSFSNDGLLAGHKTLALPAAALRLARQMVKDGADILDVGGESTRPGAFRVALAEELARVVPVIALLARSLKVPVSVDTSKMEVARAALEAGAAMVNNVRACSMGPAFMKLVRDEKAALVLMHMRGTPASMSAHARYRHVVREVIEELKISVEKCLEMGIKKDRIMVDPGIGFAKTPEQNLCLINHLDQLQVLGCPVLLGTSRKSFLGKVLRREAGDRLMGTAATVAAGILRGAHMVRVHDVKAIQETVSVTDAILHATA